MAAKPKSIRFKPSSRLATHGLARNLYPTWLVALLEIIFNGIDSATRRGVEPKIEVAFFAPGEHPMAPSAHVLTATDNGMAFTPEVLAAFGTTGESVSLGRTDIHGKHGLGKFAPFALGDDVTEFGVFSNTGDGLTWMYRIQGSTIFDQEFHAEEPPRGAKKFLPTDGPFAQIFVPGITPQNPDEIRSALSHHLPLRPLTVTVNGVKVEPRKFVNRLEFTTPSIPGIGGPVYLMFATAAVSTPDDTVHLYDTNGRQVTELVTPATRALLNQVFRHPRLIGVIKTPGLEKHSSSSRTGLNASFWSSRYGKKLLEVLEVYGVEMAKKVVGVEEDIPSDPLRSSLQNLAAAFEASFGSPDKVKEKDPRPRPTKPGGGSSGGSGGDGTTATWIRVENKAYRVMSFPTSHPLPAEVRPRSATVVVNTSHPEIKRLQAARNPRILREGLIRALVEAHVVHTRQATADHIGAVYEIAGRVYAAAVEEKK